MVLNSAYGHQCININSYVLRTYDLASAQLAVSGPITNQPVFRQGMGQCDVTHGLPVM